jgi:hypothetical protein
MAWSDNMRCLYCDGKLPLYRKITSGQFCSAVHRKAYWQEQERLAVERLHQTHDSLRAYRPADGLEAILGKAAGEPVGSGLYYLTDQVAEIEPTPEVEEIARSAANTGNVKFAGFLTEDKPALRAWEALLAAWDIEFAHWPMSAPALPSSGPPSSSNEAQEHSFATANGVALPLYHAIGLAAQIRADAENAAPVGFSAKPNTEVRFTAALDTPELTQGFLETLVALEAVVPLEALPQQVEAQPEEPSYPFSENLLALQKITAQAVSSAAKAAGPEPLETAWRAQNMRCEASFAAPTVGAVTGMLPLVLAIAPKARAVAAGVAGDARAADLQGYAQPMQLEASTGAPWMNLPMAAVGPALHFAPTSRYQIFGGAGDATARTVVDASQSMQALDLCSETATPSKKLTTQAFELSLNTAPGCRYGIQSQPGTTQRLGSVSEIASVPVLQKQLATPPLVLNLNSAEPCGLSVQSRPGIIRPLDDVQPCATRSELHTVSVPEGLGQAERNPAMAAVRPLAFAAKPCAPPAPVPVTTGVAHTYAANAPMNPVAKLGPIEGSATPPLRLGFLAGWTQTLANAGESKHVWAHAADFWQHAPRDLKLLAIAIPILLGLALRPSLPKVRVTAPTSTDGISKNIENSFRQQFVNVRNTVAERAAVSLNEDFRSGLDDWQSRGDEASGWSFDGNGFVQPGTLALYRPSLGLTDYDMEFLGLIDKKALSWVVRAKDFDNYYVVKLVVMKAGPLPTIGITRYAVIDGKAQARVDTVAAINARPDMLYRVTLNVHDDTFLLALQGTIVDNWTESRLKSGGIGFFAPKGEQSRLRWVQVTHQYDMLGRLCAYLAPYNIPTTNGSW